MEPKLFDAIIIGGGPAGVAAAIYCGRKQLKTLLLTESFGGQSIVSDDIQNWIGEPHITGLDLAKKLEAHVRSFPEVEIKIEKASKVSAVACNEERICDFEINTDKGVYKTKSVILATGARRRRLGVPGEDKFEGKGVSYCSTCDAPLFRDRKVAVVGGGNSGLEAVHDLFPYASEIYLLDGGPALKGDPSTLEEIRKNPKLKEIILNAKVLEIMGDTLVTGLKYQIHTPGVSIQIHPRGESESEKLLEVGGVFVEVGSVPNSEMVKGLVQLNDHDEVMINFQHARTSHLGIFAAGDVTDDPYKQNNISAGDGVRAALACYAYLQNREKITPAAEKHNV